MAEERKRSEETEDAGPGLAFLPFIIMEELLEKLKLLKYEKNFMMDMNMKPLSRYLIFFVKFLIKLINHWLIDFNGMSTHVGLFCT